VITKAPGRDSTCAGAGMIVEPAGAAAGVRAGAAADAPAADIADTPPVVAADTFAALPLPRLPALHPP